MLYVFEQAAWSWLGLAGGGCSSLQGTMQSAVAILDRSAEAKVEL